MEIYNCTISILKVSSLLVFMLCTVVNCFAQGAIDEEGVADRGEHADTSDTSVQTVIIQQPSLDSLRREHAKLSRYLANPRLERWVQLEGGPPTTESEDTMYVDGMRKLKDGYSVEVIELNEDCRIVETRGSISYSLESIGRVLYCEEEMALLAGFGDGKTASS